jgi:hypothetical protein
MRGVVFKDMRAFIFTLVLAFVLVLAGSGRVEALVIDYGVNLQSRGGPVQLGTVFYGDSTGTTLSTRNRRLEFTILTPGLAGALIKGFELFLDAEGVERSRNELFNIYIYDGVNPVLIGAAADNSRRGTDIPVLGGAFGSHVDSSYSKDTDNSFFLLVPGSQFADEIQAGVLRVLIQQVRGSARFDGVNLQVDDDPPPPPPLDPPYEGVLPPPNGTTVATPEPATLLLLGSGLAGLGFLGKKRRNIK